MTGAMKKVLNESDIDWNSGEAEIFRGLALRYAEIAGNEGIRVTPFLSPEMPLFQKASDLDRRNAISYLKTIVDIHEETIAAGEKTIESKKLIWRALRKLSLIPGTDLFENFSDEDVVIIYQENQSILFWNLQFFRYVSFTVEQLFFSPWFEFTKRAPEIQESLYNMALDILSGKIIDTFVPNVPGHVVEEIGTLECLKTWMELPYGSVLTREGKLGGILIVQKMRLLK